MYLFSYAATCMKKDLAEGGDFAEQLSQLIFIKNSSLSLPFSNIDNKQIIKNMGVVG